MKNLTFKAAMLKGSRPTVNRQSTDGQSQRHCKQTHLSKRWKVLMTLVFLFTFAIGQMWGADYTEEISAFSAGSGTWAQYTKNEIFVTYNIPTFKSSGIATTAKNTNSTFTISTIRANDYLKKIEFTNNANVSSLTCQPADGEIVYNTTTKIYTFTPATASKTSVSFTLYANSSGAAILKPVATTITTADNVEYISNFGVATNGVIACTSTGSAVNVIIPTSNGVSSNSSSSGILRINWGNNKIFNLEADGKYIKAVRIFYHRTNGATEISSVESKSGGENCGSYNSTTKTWSTTANVSSVSFKNTSGGGTYISGLIVTLEDAAPATYTLSAAVAETSAGYGTVSAASITEIAKDAAITINNNTLTVGSTTITATPTTQSAQYTYAFANWKLANGNDVPAKVTADLSVVANFTRTPRSYSVTLNTNEGTINAGNVTSYTFGTETTLPTNVTKENKDFLGWYADSEFTGERVYTIAIGATGNKEYWAKWQNAAQKHNIIYSKGGDEYAAANLEVGNPTEYSEGIGAGPFNALADIDGYHFTGWDPATIASTSTTDVTVTAQWVPTYSVTYNLNGAASGTQPTETAKYAGEVFTLAAQGDIVAPANKRFAGWKDQDDNKYAAEAEFTMPGKPVTLTAQWVDVVTYVASFACADAAPANWEFSKAASDTYGAEVATADYVCKFVDGGTSTPSQTEGDGTSANDVAFAKKTDAIATYDLGFTTTVTALNVTLCGGSKGGFDETIEYLGEDKSTVKKSYVTSLDAGNWKDNAISKTEDVADVRFIRVHGASKWVVMKAFSVSYIDSRTKYDVTFAKNGGSGDDMPTLKYAKGEEVTLPACTFTAPGSKEFDAWTSTDVTIANNKFTMPNKNVTITATWKTATPKYHVTYDGNSKTSGTVPTDATAYEANAQVTVLGKGDLARIIDGNAATFYGWNTKADMTGTHYDAGANFNIQEADVTLYAEWGYSIEYKLNNGSWKSGYTAPNHYIYGKGVTLPTAENVERVGFEFDGLYSEWHVINEGGYIDANKRTAVGPSDYGNASYLASWTALPLGNAQSVDLEGLVEDEGTGANWQAYMTSHGYEYSTESVSLDEKKDPSENKAYDNWPYQGLKMKKTGSYVQGTVEEGKLVVIKLGHMAAAANVTIGGVAQANATGLDAAEPAGKYNYYYIASESVLRYETTNDGACVLKAITITDPYQVTFNANGGDPVAAQYGTPKVTLPSATKGTEIFLGWFDAEEGGNKIGEAGEKYLPTADIELFAHWEAISTDARLSAITFSSNAGTLSPAFNPEVTVYTYTMPYGTAAIPQITDATSVNANAQAPIIGDAATAWGEAQTIKGVAESGDKKTYTITMLQAPKDGVSIIKATINSTTKNTIGEVTGIYKKDASTSGLSSYKFNGKGAYIGLELMAGQTFQAGDIINIHTTQASTQGSIALYNDHGNTVTPFHDYEIMGGQGDNKLVLPAAADGKSIIYVCRTEANTWNGYVDFIDVTRAMMPELTAITIDERAGEIDPLDDKHFNVTIPYEADLAALTVDPTIVWNGAHATTPMTVISHEGAWVLAADGDNTYRIMDKDGDYTDYTITLTRDVKKYTVSFNAQGGSTVQSELVVAGEKLAAAPADPTREDYLFLGWAEAAEGEVVDVTDIVINADKTFYAQWQDENPIKLIQADTINTKDFITGVSINTVQIGDVPHKCFEFAGGLSSFINIKDKNRVVVYNARTNKTKIKVSIYNDKSSALTYYIKGVVEGSTTVVNLAEVAVGSGETNTTDYIEFNNADAKNRSIYIYAETSTGNMHFLQVKVIESGDVPVKKFGEIGYSINLNQGRLFGRGNTSIDFEGIHYDLSSDYQPTSSASCKLASKAISFKLESPMTLTVTTNTNKTYYVATTSDGITNETSTSGEHEFQLTPGTWYIIGGSQNVEFTNFAFSAAKPVYTRENLNPANIGTLCVKYNGRLEGATLYELNGKNEYNKLVFDEVENNVMVAGRPYIFVPENGNTKIEVYKSNEEFAEEAGLFHGMQGTFVALSTITDGMNSPLWGNYIISNNKYIYVDAENCSLKENRAYILSLDQVPDETPAEPNTNGSPRRRVVMGGNPAPSVVTDIDNLFEGEQPMKVMIDGQLFIIRGEKMFDATGRLVK